MLPRGECDDHLARRVLGLPILRQIIQFGYDRFVDKKLEHFAIATPARATLKKSPKKTGRGKIEARRGTSLC